MTNKNTTTGTAEKILEAATELFAEKGYSDCSLSLIAEHSGTNKAAINYYFKSKELLYQKAWRIEFTKANEKYPFDGGVSKDSPAKDKLHGHIESRVKRIADPENREYDIAKNERTNPTGLLKELLKTAIKPARKILEEILKEMVDNKISNNDLDLYCHSIKALCQDIAHHKRGTPGVPKIKQNVDEIIEYIFNVSLLIIDDFNKRHRK